MWRSTALALLQIWGRGFATNAAFTFVTLQLTEALNSFQDVLYSVISEPMYDFPLYVYSLLELC